MAAVDLRYARALAAVVSDQQLDAGAVLGQLNDFAGTLAASAELREVLMDPSIPEPQKLGLLDKIAERAGMTRPVRNFVALVAKHQRLHEMSDMVAGFASVSDHTAHVAEAEVTSAHPLDQDSRQLLEREIGKLAGGGQVRATYREDASLLGGAVVKLGATIYDGSVRAQLEQMKQRMIAAGA